MLVEEHVQALQREGDLLLDASGAVDLDAMAPTCPGWTVRELLHHLGRVHRWAAAYVRDRRAAMITSDEEDQIWGAKPNDTELTDWLRDGHRALVATLSAAPADLACWTFLPAETPLTFWARRQAHETAIHRADAEAALGRQTPCPPSFAVDGIEELLFGFFARPSRRLRADPPLTMVVQTTDHPGAWTVYIGPDGPRTVRVADPAGCLVRATASDAYLWLWNRRDVIGLDISGDPAVLDLWRQVARVHWG
jgi:uncharacterized protein (TIGR03083 family)